MRSTKLNFTLGIRNEILKFFDIQIEVNSLVSNLICLILVLLWIEDIEFRPSPLKKQHKFRVIFSSAFHRSELNIQDFLETLM